MTDSPPATTPPTKLPAAIAAAGPDAVAAWEQFIEGWGLADSTRTMYRGRASGFLRWLASRGIALGQVTPQLVAEFLASSQCSPKAGYSYRTALNRLFDGLTARGVIPSNPTRATGGAGGAKDAAHGTSAKETPEGPPTLADLQELLLELDGIREGSEYYHPGLVAMYPIVVGGMDPQAISSFTGIPLEEVETYVARLRENGIWRPDGKIAVDFEDPASDEAVLNLVLIIGCAAGEFGRVPGEAEGEGSPSVAVPEVSPGPNPIHAVLSEFLQGLSSSSRVTYRSIVKRFLRWLEPQGVQPAEATPETVERFLDGVPASSRYNYRIILRRFLLHVAGQQGKGGNEDDTNNI